MATVPSYSGGVRQDSSSLPTQRGNASPLAFGGGLAQGLEKLGGVAGNAADAMAAHAVEFQRQDNKAATDDGLTAFINQTDARLYNPETGYFTKLGKDAVDGYGETQADLNKLREDISSGLPNEAARRDFDTASRRQLAYSLGDMSRHAAGERKKWMVGASDGKIEAAKNSAAFSAFNDAKFADSLVILEGENRAKGKLTGQSEEEVSARTFNDVSDAWKRRLQRINEVNPSQAETLYKANTGKFTDEDSVFLDHAIKTALIPQQSLEIAKGVVHAKGGLSVDEQLPLWIKEGQDAAEKLRPGDDVFAERVGARINAQASQMRAIENIGKRYQAEQNAIVSSDLEIRVNAGEATEAEVDNAFNKKQISGPARASWITKLRKEENYQGVVLDALSGKRFLDPKDAKDRNAASTYFDKVVAPALAQTTPLEAKNGITNYVGKTGIIPETVQGQIRGGLRSGTPDQKAGAADLLDRFSAAAPSATQDFSVEDIALGKQIAQAVRDGVPAETAVEHAEEMGKLSADVIKRRKDELSANPSKDSEGVSAGTLSRQGTQAVIDEAQGHVWFGRPTVDDAALAEFRRDFESAYIRTGDYKASVEAAKSVTKRTWGITNVNGRSTLMKYAPETIYGVFDKGIRDSGWIKKQLYEDVVPPLSKGVMSNGMLPGHEGNLDKTKASDNWTTVQLSEDGVEKHYVLPTRPDDKPPSGDGIVMGSAVDRFLKDHKHYGAFDSDETAAAFMQGKSLPKAEDLHLAADPQTARDLTYVVMKKNEFGEFEPIVGANGKPRRWRPDYKASTASADAAKAKAAEVEAARTRAAVINALPPPMVQ